MIYDEDPYVPTRKEWRRLRQLDTNVEQLQAENSRLREAIRRLADQDATLSVCDGSVTVTIDAALTDAEREAVELACSRLTADPYWSALTTTLRGLLERIK